MKKRGSSTVDLDLNGCAGSGRYTHARVCQHRQHWNLQISCGREAPCTSRKIKRCYARNISVVTHNTATLFDMPIVNVGSIYLYLAWDILGKTPSTRSCGQIMHFTQRMKWNTVLEKTCIPSQDHQHCSSRYIIPLLDNDSRITHYITQVVRIRFSTAFWGL